MAEESCAFPYGPSKKCGKNATHEYRLGEHWIPCCDIHTKTAEKLRFEVRPIE